MWAGSDFSTSSPILVIVCLLLQPSQGVSSGVSLQFDLHFPEWGERALGLNWALSQ